MRDKLLSKYYIRAVKHPTFKFPNPIKLKFYKDELLFISNWGDVKNNSLNGYISIYDSKKNKEVHRIIMEHPKVIELLDENSLLVSEYLSNEIKLVNLKNDEVVPFIKNKEFVSISSIKVVNNLVIVLDIYSHTIFFYNTNGYLLNKICFYPNFAFPIEMTSNKNYLIIIFFNSINVPNSYYDKENLSENNLAFFSLKNKKINKKIAIMSKDKAPTAIVTQKDIFYLLKNHYILKYDYNFNLIYKKNIIDNINPLKYKHHDFFSMDIDNEGRLFVLETNVNKGVYIYETYYKN